jgi:hypothetical protein
MRILLLFSLWVATNTLQAQVISGTTLSESGLGASAVTVFFSNRDNKVETSPEGRFVITATKLPDTLFFEGPGIMPYHVIITEKTLKDPNFEIVLLNDRNAKIVRDSDYPMDKTTLTRETPIRNAPPKSVKSKSADKKMAAEAMPEPASYSTSEPSTIDRSIALPGKRPRQQAAARTMTAGEVNDLHKWLLWEDYSASEFERISQITQLPPLHRFSVQVTTADGFPAVAKKVSLIENGVELWHAVTDNTGKAELWVRDVSASGKTIERRPFDIQLDDIKMRAKPFEKGMNHIKLKQNCQPAGGVDIAFVVDATGSMGDEIEFLKLEIEYIIREAFSQFDTDGFLRVGSVFYRDKDDQYETKPFELNDDLLKVLNFIKLQSATGGGDRPEALAEAFQSALDSLTWRPESRARLLFLIADAPPQPNTYGQLYKLYQQAAAKGIRVVTVGCSGTDRLTEYIMRYMSNTTNGTYLAVTDHSGVGAKHDEPLTDSYRVELLADAIGRLIVQYSYVSDCQQQTFNPTDTTQTVIQPPVQDIANPAKLVAQPNPTNGPLRLVHTDQFATFWLCDFNGKVLERFEPGPRAKHTDINLVQYPAGVYVIRYTLKDGTIGGIQVVLQHS